MATTRKKLTKYPYPWSTVRVLPLILKRTVQPRWTRVPVERAAPTCRGSSAVLQCHCQPTRLQGSSGSHPRLPASLSVRPPPRILRLSPRRSPELPIAAAVAAFGYRGGLSLAAGRARSGTVASRGGAPGLPVDHQPRSQLHLNSRHPGNQDPPLRCARLHRRPAIPSSHPAAVVGAAACAPCPPHARGPPRRGWPREPADAPAVGCAGRSSGARRGQVGGWRHCE